MLGNSDGVTVPLVVFQGFVARAQGLHDAAADAIDSRNSHAAFTVLRAYAENTAAILFVKDNSGQLNAFADPNNHGIKIGRITNHARARFDGFADIYDQLRPSPTADSESE